MTAPATDSQEPLLTARARQAVWWCFEDGRAPVPALVLSVRNRTTSARAYVVHPNGGFWVELGGSTDHVYWIAAARRESEGHAALRAFHH